MRAWCFVFVLGAVVGVRIGFSVEPDPCADPGNFPCVAAGKTTDDIADAALKLEKLYAGKPIGTCKVFAQRVFDQIKDQQGLGPRYRQAYCNCGYEILNPADVVRGDIIQVSYDPNPEFQEDYLHTAFVLKNHGDGTFDVIESNWHLDLKIGTRAGDERWNPQQYASKWPNWNAHFYRLAPLPGGPPPYPVSSIFAGRDAGLGFAISPAYDGPDGVYQDFKTGRLFFDGTWGTITIKAYPNGVGPGWFMSGWDDTASLAFARRYGQLIQKHHGNRLGFPFDDGAGAYVRLLEVFGSFGTQVLLQTFHQPTPPNFGPNGQSALVIETREFEYLARPTAVHIQGEFWRLYRADPAFYGVPVTEQGVWVDYRGDVGPAGYAYLRQDFNYHHSMLWHPGEVVKFVGSPDSPPCWPEVCTDVGGGTDPLTLTGWPVSNRQVYLRASGGVELDQHGYRAWYINGVYHSTTHTPELTIIGLEPGVTYTFRTEQVQNDELVATSTNLTLTLPAANEFSLHVEPRTANSVSLSITNRRFAVVWYYLVLRDGQEIARLSGVAAGDFDLDYNRTYTYQVVAMTASHMELGRTATVAITTQPQPVTPQPLPDPSRPTSIVPSLDRAEARVHESARVSAIVYDQLGQAMLGLRVVYVSAKPDIAYPDGDTGVVSVNQPGTVEFHAELYDDRNLWSPPVTFTVHPADWTASVPPVWRGIAGEELLSPDAGLAWWDSDHPAWRSSLTYLTVPITYFSTVLYLKAQYYEDGLPVDGFTWQPADGRLGVVLQTTGPCVLNVNGHNVGAWGRPYDYGTQPINLPERGTPSAPSITLPPVDITPHLTAGKNSLTLLVTAGRGYAELRHLELVKLGNALPVPAPSVRNGAQTTVVFADDFSGGLTTSAPDPRVFADDFNSRSAIGSAWATCGDARLTEAGALELQGTANCSSCGLGGNLALSLLDFPALVEPAVSVTLYLATDYAGPDPVLYPVRLGDVWVGVDTRATQLFYRGNPLARQDGFRPPPGWYELVVSGGEARFRTLRLRDGGPTVDLAGTYDPASPPRLDQLCVVANGLERLVIDDVVVRDPTVPVPSTARPAWQVCGDARLTEAGALELHGTANCSSCGLGGNLALSLVTFPTLGEPEVSVTIYLATDYAGHDPVFYPLRLGDVWVGVDVRATQLFYRGNPLARQDGFRPPPGWYELVVSGGEARFRTLRLREAGPEVDLAGTYDPASPPRLDQLCVVANGLERLVIDDVVVRDLSVPPPSPPAALSNLVLELKLQSAEVTTDDQAVPEVRVSNLSPTACPSSRLSLLVDGQLQHTFTIPELAASDSHTFPVTLDRLAEGVHTVAIVAECDADIAESDERNGAELTFTVAPARRSDLYLSALDIPARGYTGATLPCTVVFGNDGDAPSPPCLFILGFGGTTEASTVGATAGPLQFIVPELAPGAKVTFLTSLTLAVADTFTVWVEVDVNREVREWDEANNQASVSFTIVPTPSNLVIPTVTMTPAMPTTTDAVTFTTTVKNDGPGPSAACQLTGSITYGQSPWGDLPAVTIPALAAGTSVTLDVAGGPFLLSGTYAAAFTADSGNLISEIKEDDNTKNISFTTFPALASLPPPQYAFARTEDYTTSSGAWTRYSFTCLNWSAYPDAIFRSEPSVVCGSPNASRTWVDIWAVNAVGSKSHLYSFCRFSSTQHLNGVWFALPRGTLPPAQICVTLTDMVDRTVLTSNLVAIPRPTVVVFADNFEAGLAKWRLNAGASGFSPFVARRISPAGGKLASNGAFVLYLGDSTAGGYATATAEFTVNLAGYTQAVLEFDWSTFSLVGLEGVTVDVYDGVWTKDVVRHTAPGWRHTTVDLSRFRLRNNMVIRFRSYMDYPESSNAAYVDNVKVTAR